MTRRRKTGIEPECVFELGDRGGQLTGRQQLLPEHKEIGRRFSGHDGQQRAQPGTKPQGTGGNLEIASAGPADQLSESGTPFFWISSMV